MTTTTDAGAAALALCGIALEGIAWALRAVLVPALALLLTVASYRRSGKPQSAPEALTAAVGQQLQPKATKPHKRASRAGISAKAKTTTTAAVAA